MRNIEYVLKKFESEDLKFVVELRVPTPNLFSNTSNFVVMISPFLHRPSWRTSV
jgi:hypothetical protein